MIKYCLKIAITEEKCSHMSAYLIIKKINYRVKYF